MHYILSSEIDDDDHEVIKKVILSKNLILNITNFIQL